MDSILAYFNSIHPVLAALIAGICTWLLTAVGASVILFIKNFNLKIQDILLGFTGGVMLAASIWSLIIPAIEMSPDEGIMKALPAAIGISLGALALYVMDKLLPHFHSNEALNEGPKSTMHRSTLMVLAITLHNIPEGLAIGVMFGGVAAGIQEATMSGALMLALAIGLQNLPEGLAVSIPLRRAGLSKGKSFMYGQASALVEPIAAVIGAYAVTLFSPILPYALTFAAGAMIFVIIEEVIPETQQNKNTDLAVLGFILGFIIMMMMDVGIG